MRFKRMLLAFCAPFFLTSCLLLPGKFDAALDIRRDGSFSFRYAGELIVADPSPKPAPFVSYGCFDKESGDERECSEQEVADQRTEFEEQQAADTSVTSMGGPGGDLSRRPQRRSHAAQRQAVLAPAEGQRTGRTSCTSSSCVRMSAMLLRPPTVRAAIVAAG